MRKRVAAIIIEDKKILLVRDNWADFFSLPGGLVEEDENPEIALYRELEEELKIKVEILKLYHSYNCINTKFNLLQNDINYLVSLIRTPRASSEIAEMRWFSKENIQSEKAKISHIFLDHLRIKPLIITPSERFYPLEKTEPNVL
ncbi:NUDIX hydrolase [Candidatus Pacearchaeota archaeon]|nr:NUDIX hydrolase [Candidatus Pacearchaeota archaeon]